MNNINLLDEYKILYENTRRDNDKFIEVMLTLRDVITSMKDTVKDLQNDNKSLRTQLSILHHRNSQQVDQQRELNEQLPNQISTIIDIIEEEEEEEEDRNREEEDREFPHYSIPPHIRQAYLRDLDNQQCAVCLETIENDQTVQLTECGHLFHMNCLRRHRNSDSETNNTCPVCRTYLN